MRTASAPTGRSTAISPKGRATRCFWASASRSTKRVVDPQPAPHLLDAVEGMRDELRRPMMLIVSAEKAR